VIKNSYPIKLDVSDKKQVEQGVKEVISKFGRVDILINNAGIAEWGKVIDVPYEHFERHISVNLLGAIYCTKAVLPYMVRQKSGVIINISSGLGKRGEAEASAYSASKFGMMGFSESIADEFKEYNIKVSTISPGEVDTPIHDSYLEKNSDRRGLMLKPGDIAELSLFLASLPYRVGIREVGVRSNYL
jgi:3-oxoacyl-[acyl-carrier protein] reductase